MQIRPRAAHELKAENMGSTSLSGRKNWQNVSGEKAMTAESRFEDVFSRHFKGTEYRMRSRPKELKRIYMDVELDESVLKTIYTPKKPYKIHGIVPDFAIDNVKTNKTLYGDSKRQDGWVENKHPSAGRGNVHERACRYFSPGLMNVMRRYGKLGDEVLPFWIVFQGNITRDPKRVRELHQWFGPWKNHFCLWHDVNDEAYLIDHFNTKLKPLLE